MSPERRQHRPYLFTREDVARFAREAALEKGELLPTLIVEGDKGAAFSQIEAFPDTHAARKEWMFLSGYGLAKSRTVSILRQVFLISEGWLSEASGDRPLETTPAQDPDRKEVLFVSGFTVEEQKASMDIFEMLRDGEDNLVELRDFEPAKDRDRGGHVESPLLSAFVAGFRAGVGGKFN